MSQPHAQTRAQTHATGAPPLAAPDLAPDLAVTRVRLAAALRAGFLARLWEAPAAGPDPLAALSDPPDTAAAEAEWRATDPAAAPLAARLAALEAALETDPPAPFARLAEVFRPAPEDWACLYLALAFRADPGLGPLLAHVAPGAGADYPTEALAARLFLDRAADAWRAEGPFARWRLLHRVAQGAGPARLVLDEGLWAWVMGRAGPPPELLGALWPLRAPAPLPHWQMTDVLAEARALIARGAPVQIGLAGGPGSGRKSAAAALAGALGLSAFALDLGRIAPEDRLEALILGHRHGWLSHAAPMITGAAPPALPADLAPFPLSFVALPDSPEAAGCDLVMRLDPPDAATRAALWRAHCPEAAAWPEDALAALARDHASPPGAIAAVAARAPASPEAAAAGLARRNAAAFGALARRLDTPFAREDLVLPARLSASVETLIHEARARTRLWERPEARALYPAGRGLVALMTGPPGTGKTMAAQVLAAELGRELWRVEVSTLVSKYIGETMENIQRLIDIARQTDAVILFDEADGFFARRTDLSSSNDRHANQDTGHLLQAIESFDGIAVLTTNRRRNIDEAFQRRLRYVLDFPPPDAAARAAIWAKVLGPLFGQAGTALAPAAGRIAERIEMTGAQIKQAALTAHFAADRRGAAAPDLGDLIAGIDAELMKEGRALSARERAELEGAS